MSLGSALGGHRRLPQGGTGLSHRNESRKTGPLDTPAPITTKVRQEGECCSLGVAPPRNPQGGEDRKGQQRADSGCHERPDSHGV